MATPAPPCGLTNRQFSAVSRYYEGATQRNVGHQLGINRSAVTRLISRAEARSPEIARALADRRRRDKTRFI